MFDALVVVAESSRAIVYAMENKGRPMRELVDMIHSESRLHEQELISDRPGRTFDSKGFGRHAKETGIHAKEQEAIKFASRITDYIESERNKHNFNCLVLIATPDFLGLLRKSLSKEAHKLIAKEIDKNLVLMDEASIREYLT
jgi:Protein required for attachment to host cells